MKHMILRLQIKKQSNGCSTPDPRSTVVRPSSGLKELARDEHEEEAKVNTGLGLDPEYNEFCWISIDCGTLYSLKNSVSGPDLD